MDPILRKIGIKTGCPCSVVNFTLAIKPWLKWVGQCVAEGVQSPYATCELGDLLSEITMSYATAAIHRKKHSHSAEHWTSPHIQT